MHTQISLDLARDTPTPELLGTAVIHHSYLCSTLATTLQFNGTPPSLIPEASQQCSTVQRGATPPQLNGTPLHSLGLALHCRDAGWAKHCRHWMGNPNTTEIFLILCSLLICRARYGFCNCAVLSPNVGDLFHLASPCG